MSGYEGHTPDLVEEAKNRALVLRDHATRMRGPAAYVDGPPLLADADLIESLLTRVEALERGLGEAAIVLEVLAGQIAEKPYTELTADFQRDITAAALLVRGHLLNNGNGEGTPE